MSVSNTILINFLNNYVSVLTGAIQGQSGEGGRKTRTLLSWSLQSRPDRQVGAQTKREVEGRAAEVWGRERKPCGGWQVDMLRSQHSVAMAGRIRVGVPAAGDRQG